MDSYHTSLSFGEPFVCRPSSRALPVRFFLRFFFLGSVARAVFSCFCSLAFFFLLGGSHCWFASQVGPLVRRTSRSVWLWAFPVCPGSDFRIRVLVSFFLALVLAAFSEFFPRFRFFSGVRLSLNLRCSGKLLSSPAHPLGFPADVPTVTRTRSFLPAAQLHLVDFFLAPSRLTSWCYLSLVDGLFGYCWVFVFGSPRDLFCGSLSRVVGVRWYVVIFQGCLVGSSKVRLRLSYPQSQSKIRGSGNTATWKRDCGS